MKDYSIENSVEKIYSEQTKKYFKEVSSSYYNNNYRASIVTLYSVVINDILQKLEVLDEIYSDSVAKNILSEIKIFQTEKPNSPEWEKSIIEKVKERTSLIDNVDYAHIQALKNDRHLCAHPVISKEEKLYTPNKETVASHIRNMLESFFLKPPILSKKILTTILIDIASKDSLLIDEESLEKYVKSKYLSNLNDSVEIALFRDLWKFIYFIDAKDCDRNRLINFRVLYLLYKRNMPECISKIKTEKEYFNNIRNDDNTIDFLIRFISENEFLFEEFREDIQLLISKRIECDPSGKTVAWFLNGSYPLHLNMIKKQIENNFDDKEPYDASSMAYQRLIKIGYAKGYQKEVSEFIVWRYSNCKSYNDADKAFEYILYPYVNKLTEEEITELCTNINSNSQVYDRKDAEEDHKKLRRNIEEKFKTDFNFQDYKNIFK